MELRNISLSTLHGQWHSAGWKEKFQLNGDEWCDRKVCANIQSYQKRAIHYDLMASNKNSSHISLGNRWRYEYLFMHIPARNLINLKLQISRKTATFSWLIASIKVLAVTSNNQHVLHAKLCWKHASSREKKKTFPPFHEQRSCHFESSQKSSKNLVFDAINVETQKVNWRIHPTYKNRTKNCNNKLFSLFSPVFCWMKNCFMHFCAIFVYLLLQSARLSLTLDLSNSPEIHLKFVLLLSNE